ncbi:MAG TPA: hypothetical protein PKY59_05955 [Pyrinomonadaceae bacterium]|nr:hypothetical protein [Pyrinomonadaceae bacterium]
MVDRNDWYPSKRPDQRAMYANFLAKIDTHAPTLALTSDLVLRLKLICQTFIAIHDWLDQLEATVSQAYDWRDDMETGDESEPPNKPPSFQELTISPDAFKGFVTEFREKVRQIKDNDAYTVDMGKDLKIVRAKGEELSLADAKPLLKFASEPNFSVNISGKLQSFSAVKIYYRRRGTTEWVYVGFLTKLPGSLQITPAQAGVPEAGDIRARFVDDNQEVGQFSDNAEITLS